MTSLAGVPEREEEFIMASDLDRLKMLARGQAPATDRLVYLALQSLARAELNKMLGAPASSAVPLK
jgi:hypothetical protein